MKKMVKAVFLDRDGVINVDKGYVYKLNELEFIPGSIYALKKLKNLGYLLIIITNQSGIGRGYYSEEDYLKFKEEFHEKINKEGVKIDAEYYCPHAPEENCGCRKPNIKLIKKAIEEHNVDVNDSFFIGDKTADIQAGKNSDLKTMLVKTGKAGKDCKYNLNPDFVCIDLLDCAKRIADFK